MGCAESGVGRRSGRVIVAGVAHVTFGTLLSPTKVTWSGAADASHALAASDSHSSPLPEACGRNSELIRYKARPLHGIWATAPFLHNGSVMNLYELLLPAKDRRRVFYVGGREFDAVRIGLDTRRGPGRTRVDTSLPGNSRIGHEYATQRLSRTQRWRRSAGS